ncbi:nicalin-1 [Galendromus occidentalis]|uniref:BOS complex subunit NCLN n=1 Tax=Galendromus occidentalis TaxID=34638 RepID=A0AAJ6VYZ4_9ACAR|nr:nicalin-1 [Galendromus occidentalis]
MGLLDLCMLAWLALSVHAIVELPAYRMQHFELLGITRGSKAYSLNGEAVTWSTLSGLRSGSGMIALLKWSEIPLIREAVARGVFGVILVLPPDSPELPPNEDHMANEFALFEETHSTSIYIVKDSPEIREAFERAHRPNAGAFDLGRLWSGKLTQLTITAPAPQVIRQPRLPTLHGMLPGFGVQEQLPTVAVVAHYDAFAAAADLAYGADSNGSGIAAVLELLRLFSRLYSGDKMHPRANLIFVLSGGGKLNYQGTKKLVEDAVESANSDSILADSLFTICLESIGSKPELVAHVSKPPRPDNAMRKFFNILNVTGDVPMVHKKINLAEEMRVWEHERFSLSKLPAFTLSSLANHNSRSRMSLFDQRIDISALEENVRRIAVAISAFVYQRPAEVTDEFFKGELAVSREHLQAVVDFVTSRPRSTQVLLEKSNDVVSSLEKMMNRYLLKSTAKISIFEPDRREPEFVLYDQTAATLQISEVKPVLFDILLFSIIVVYLAVVYVSVSEFGLVVRALSPRKAKKVD